MTPKKLYSTVTPDILVKGGDYKINQIVGSTNVLRNGGKVISLKYKKNLSTSIIAHKILEL